MLDGHAVLLKRGSTALHLAVVAIVLLVAVTAHAARAGRRQVTTPGPFGDLPLLDGLLQWIEEYGIDYAVQRFHDKAVGTQ